MSGAVYVVIGGGPDGAFYARQLLRAADAGRLAPGAIRVVDRDPACAAAALRDPRLRLEVADWDEWLDAHLADLGPAGQIVPYHWAPHLLLGWLERQAHARGLGTRREPSVPGSGLPYEADTRDGSRALSFATWVCPLTCIEPALCPHTRGPRDWSLCSDLAGGRRPRAPLEHRIVWRCLHHAWGVGTIPVAEVLAGRDRLLAEAAQGERLWLVATASHCHGLAARLRVGPRDLA